MKVVFVRLSGALPKIGMCENLRKSKSKFRENVVVGRFRWNMWTCHNQTKLIAY